MTRSRVQQVKLMTLERPTKLSVRKTRFEPWVANEIAAETAAD